MKFYTEIYPNERLYIRHEKLGGIRDRAELISKCGNVRVKAWGNTYEPKASEIIADPSGFRWLTILIISTVGGFVVSSIMLFVFSIMKITLPYSVVILAGLIALALIGTQMILYNEKECRKAQIFNLSSPTPKT